MTTSHYLLSRGSSEPIRRLGPSNGWLRFTSWLGQSGVMGWSLWFQLRSARWHYSGPGIGVGLPGFPVIEYEWVGYEKIVLARYFGEKRMPREQAKRFGNMI
jgi:hypothetical protein